MFWTEVYNYMTIKATYYERSFVMFLLKVYIYNV